MSVLVNPKLIFSIDNFTFYANSGSVFLTAKAVEPYIVNNKIVIEKNGFCQLKFKLPVEGFSTEKIFANRYVYVEVDIANENCQIRGIDCIRWIPVKFICYENNHRNIVTE